MRLVITSLSFDKMLIFCQIFRARLLICGLFRGPIN